MPGPGLTVVVPAYNEEAALPQFLPRLLDCCERNDWQLVVVDDGSTDGTAAVLARSGHPRLRVVRHKVNRGYGGALKSGIRTVQTPYVVTVDADGQHDTQDIEALFAELRALDADMVVGSRKGQSASGWYRDLGKSLIRTVAHLLMDLNVYDINSGLKAYDAELAKRYLHLCPDSMAFSDVITMVFVSQRHRVRERPIHVRPRVAGTSTITTATALETVKELLNIVVLFNPMRIFLPISLASFVLGVGWGLPIVWHGHGVSVGAMLAIVTGVVFFLLGLLAEQISLIRRS
jgi:glycosyltransferase involved in cell wall biosynthesis